MERRLDLLRSRLPLTNKETSKRKTWLRKLSKRRTKDPRRKRRKLRAKPKNKPRLKQLRAKSKK